MSRLPHIPVVEWSPTTIRAIDPSNQKVRTFETMSEALAVLGNPKGIILALARRQTFVRTVRLPDVDKSQAMELLKFQIDDTFPVDSGDLAYDLEFTDNKTSEGRLAVVVAAQTKVLADARNSLEGTGTKVIRTVTTALGSGPVALSASLPNSIVIDRVAVGVSFDVVEDGRVIYSRTANISDIDTEAVQRETLRTLASAKKSSSPVVATPLVATPADAILSTTDTLSVLTDANTSINLLLPDDVKKESESKIKNRRNLALLMLLATLTIAVMVWLDYDDASIATNKQVEVWQRANDRIKDKNNVTLNKLREVESKGNLVISAFEPTQYASDVATATANSTIEGVWLTGMTYDRGRPLTLRGVAKTNPQLANFVDMLSASPRLRDVTLSFSNNSLIEETPVVQFSITAHVIGNFPLEDPPKSNSRSRSSR